MIRHSNGYMGLIEIVERIGVCESKGLGYRTLFHRGKVKLSRKYRVWLVPGDSRSMLLDPSEFMDRYETIVDKKR